MDLKGKRLVVIGAGPMGLYAAFAAARRNLDVTVLECDRIGASLLSWGPTRFFSPLDMNVPAAVRAALPDLPPGDALLSGPEMADRVLLPLSRLPLLADRIRLRHRVVSVGRAGLSREDWPDHPIRHEKPFRMLVEGPEGEYILEADRIFDASGAYGLTNAMGAGGLPTPGERALDRFILRRLGEVEAFLESFRTGRILLVGHGHSAAHALLALRDAAARHPGITATWAFRSRNTRPVRETAEDPLSARDAVVTAANALAAAPPSFLDIRRAASIVSLENSGARMRVGFTSGAPAEVDAIFSLTGYRPDFSFLSELALDPSPASQGARGLHAILNGASDCLSVPVPGAADLGSGESGFHLLGAKSYGRSGAFLLRDGILHLEILLEHAFG